MKEWYLLNNNTKPNVLGGFENQVFNDYKNDAFSETLETDIATTVTLYNNTLSENLEVRCIIQGNTADTNLKSMERIGLFQIGTIKTGMYIYFENAYWIVDGRPGNNTIYEKVTLKLCQYILRWQTYDGVIHERPINLNSASKYDVGESGNNTIILSSNNHIVKIGYDENALELDGMRVFIDKRKVKPEKVFKFTRTDDVLYDFDEQGSILEFIADKTEFNANADNQELRICDYHEPTTTTPSTPSNPVADKMAILKAKITGGDKLRCGRKRTWSVKFLDSDDNELADCDFSWNIVSDFDVSKAITDNKIQLYMNNEELIGSSFLLQIIVDDNVLAETLINVIDMI